MNELTRTLFSDPEFVRMWQSFEQMNRKRETDAAKADPLAHKLTRTFGPGVSTNYRYWGPVKNGKGQKVRFCWSSHRNAAGFFLGWREVIGKRQTKRDRWYSRRVKARCAEIAKRRYEKATAAAGPSRHSAKSAPISPTDSGRNRG